MELSGKCHKARDIFLRMRLLSTLSAVCCFAAVLQSSWRISQEAKVYITSMG